MAVQGEAQARAAAAYNAAADSYDDPANSFWARFGKSTVERLGLRPGERVHSNVGFRPEADIAKAAAFSRDANELPRLP
jgi:hypothetical protein